MWPQRVWGTFSISRPPPATPQRQLERMVTILVCVCVCGCLPFLSTGWGGSGTLAYLAKKNDCVRPWRASSCDDAGATGGLRRAFDDASTCTFSTTRGTTFLVFQSFCEGEDSIVQCSRLTSRPSFSFETSRYRQQPPPPLAATQCTPTPPPPPHQALRRSNVDRHGAMPREDGQARGSD